MQRDAIDIQSLRSARLVAAALFKHAQDVEALGIFQFPDPGGRLRSV